MYTDGPMLHSPKQPVLHIVTSGGAWSVNAARVSAEPLFKQLVCWQTCTVRGRSIDGFYGVILVATLGMMGRAIVLILTILVATQQSQY